jgi:transcription elongation factor Elf1
MGSVLECKACHAPVGDAAKAHPFRVDGGSGDWETFCPQCFVHVRAPLEPLRYQGAYAAVQCSGCGTSSVAVGILRCAQCGRQHGLLVLPPKDEADGWSRAIDVEEELL